MQLHGVVGNKYVIQLMTGEYSVILYEWAVFLLTFEQVGSIFTHPRVVKIRLPTHTIRRCIPWSLVQYILFGQKDRFINKYVTMGLITGYMYLYVCVMYSDVTCLFNAPLRME